MLRERWDEIVPADNHAVKIVAREKLARPPKRLDAKRWCLDMLVCWYTLVLSPVEEVLAFVRNECPFCKSTAGVTTRCCSFACGLNAADRIGVYTFLLEQNLRRKWKSRWLEPHVLVSAKPFVDPFEGEAKAVSAVGRGWRRCGCRCWLLHRLVLERNFWRRGRFDHVLLVLSGCL